MKRFIRGLNTRELSNGSAAENQKGTENHKKTAPRLEIATKHLKLKSDKTKRIITLIYVFALLNFSGFTAHTQTITQLSFYSSISIFDMQYLNNHLVVSQNGLLIFDITNPSRIQLVSQSAFPDGVAHQIAAQGNYAYMAEGNNGLFAVYNISNFNAPFLTGSVSIPNATGGLAPYGNYVYITGVDSVFVVDVSNPSSPQVVKRVFMSRAGTAGGGAMRINGHSLFIMTTSSLKVFDISNPANPVFTTSVAFSHYSEQGLSADTVNHRLFLPWVSPVEPQFMGYDAYDVSNPSSPVFLFRDSTAYSGGGFGNSAYSYTDNVLFLNEFATIEAFDASSANHKFLASFHGTAIANEIVAIDTKDSVFFDAKGGGIEVLKYTPPAGTCNTPAGLNAGNITRSSAALSWTTVNGALGYNLQWKAASSATWTTVTDITTIPYKLTGLSSNTNYKFRVQTVCSSGSSAYSGSASFRTSGSHSLSYIAQTNSDLQNMNQEYTTDLSIYPNPAEDNLTVEFTGNSNGNVKVNVYNPLGQKVMNIVNPSVKGLNTFKLNTSKLGTGFYIFEIENNGLVQRQKFLISR